MSSKCYNMTWSLESRQIGRAYMALAIPALIFHTLFWIQIALHPTLRQKSMLWVYNYLITDIILLLQLFIEYSVRTMSSCVTHAVFKLFCHVEAYTNTYMTILEAYMLVCLNITRYYLIVKNCDISSRYPYTLATFNGCLYLFGITKLLIQGEVFKLIDVSTHPRDRSCRFEYNDTTTRFGNLTVVLIIPIILNCYFMGVTTLFVRRSQLASGSQRSKHLQLLIQFFVLYSLWLILWAPNVIVSYIVMDNDPTSYTRFGSIASALCDPLIFMFVDRRFLKAWKDTSDQILRCGHVQRQIHPTTVSHDHQVSIVIT